MGRERSASGLWARLAALTALVKKNSEVARRWKVHYAGVMNKRSKIV